MADAQAFKLTSDGGKIQSLVVVRLKIHSGRNRSLGNLYRFPELHMYRRLVGRCRVASILCEINLV